MDLGAGNQDSASSLSHKNEALAPPSLAELHDRLDSLWIKYLDHLDNYTTSQKVLQKHLSSGYFSLARANFASRTGRRFGQDYYHDGAVATRRVKVDVEQENIPRVKSYHWGDPENTESTAEVVTATQLPSPAATPEPVEKQPDAKAEADSTAESGGAKENRINVDGDPELRAKPAKPALECDSLRWFGVLVPRELRDAHSSFNMAFDEALDGAVNGARGMREIEVEIRRLRKDLRKAQRNV